MDDLIGWWLDEYDGPRFRQYVNVRGGTPYVGDPLARAEGECWEWTGTLDENGYGGFMIGRKFHPAHRVAYLDGGRRNIIPEGHVIDHLCRNTSCVNPLHLEPVPHRENVGRGLVGRDANPTCRKGHEYTEENTMWWRNRGRLYRKCRTCNREYARARYAAKKAAA